MLVLSLLASLILKLAVADDDCASTLCAAALNAGEVAKLNGIKGVTAKGDLTLCGRNAMWTWSFLDNDGVTQINRYKAAQTELVSAGDITMFQPFIAGKSAGWACGGRPTHLTCQSFITALNANNAQNKVYWLEFSYNHHIVVQQKSAQIRLWQSWEKGGAGSNGWPGYTVGEYSCGTPPAAAPATVAAPANENDHKQNIGASKFRYGNKQWVPLATFITDLSNACSDVTNNAGGAILLHGRPQTGTAVACEANWDDGVCVQNANAIKTAIDASALSSLLQTKPRADRLAQKLTPKF